MMKLASAVRNVFTVLGVVLVAMLLTFTVRAQWNGNQANRNLLIPSVFNLTFGDTTATDIALQKNGANVLGVSGNIGGGGLVANTTAAPAGPYAWGQVTLAANTATVIFAKPFTNPPVCFATDQTTPQLVKASATATQVVITDTVGATDVVSWMCHGNPN